MNPLITVAKSTTTTQVFFIKSNGVISGSKLIDRLPLNYFDIFTFSDFETSHSSGRCRWRVRPDLEWIVFSFPPLRQSGHLDGVRQDQQLPVERDRDQHQKQFGLCHSQENLEALKCCKVKTKSRLFHAT